MKLNKEQRKLLVKKIKEFAKKEGYRVRDYSIFKKIGENFMDMAFNFIDGTKIGYSIGIKKYVYDDIFWEIMNMSENSKESESLRSVGAFLDSHTVTEYVIENVQDAILFSKTVDIPSEFTGTIRNKL